MASLRPVASSSRVTLACSSQCGRASLALRPPRPRPRACRVHTLPPARSSPRCRLTSNVDSSAARLRRQVSTGPPSSSSDSIAHDYSNHANPIVRLAYLTFDDARTCIPDPASSRFAGELDPSSPHYAQLAKQAAEQRDVREAWSRWKALEKQRQAARAMLAGGEEDEEMRALAEEEVESLLEEQESIFSLSFRDALLEASSKAGGKASSGGSTPTSSNGSGSSLRATGAIIELRPAIGGDESSLFVGEMTRMYQRWCASAPLGTHWKVTMLSSTPVDAMGTASGALKEAILQVDGEGAYEALKYEAGIHRVQRIPETTSVAKLQSSTMTIVVLPIDTSSSSPSGSGEQQQQRADDIVDPQDVKTEVMRSRGAGGQHVNKTESAIRLTHLPTGISVSMQDSRSQHQNREKAWQVLRARLLDLDMKRKEQEARDVRGEQIVGLGRGDRVRTYNFPQDRVTDHRLGENVGSIDAFMEGEGEGLTQFVEGLAEEGKSLAIQERLRSLLQCRDSGAAQDGSENGTSAAKGRGQGSKGRK
ncbi:unnamed protein product [Parajaminaea phylloscopi]